MPAIAALGFKRTPGRTLAGALEPEAGLSPVQDQIAVEEFERRRFLCGRLIAAGGEALNKGRVPGAAQHGAKRNDALQTRDRYAHCLRDGPGPAVHRFAIARAAPHPGHV